MTQSGMASARFWLIAFNPAIEITKKYGIFGNTFADDCGAILVPRRNSSEANGNGEAAKND